MRVRAFSVAVGLVVFVGLAATGRVAEAKPFFGANCADCHGGGSGDLQADPNPVDIVVGGNGVITFNILANPDRGAIAVTGLDAPGLDASVVGPGWTAGSGYYYSNTFRGTSPYALELAVGPAAVEGLYNLGVQFAGKPGFWGGVYGASVNVVQSIPEPATLATLTMLAVGAAAVCRRRTARRA